MEKRCGRRGKMSAYRTVTGLYGNKNSKILLKQYFTVFQQVCLLQNLLYYIILAQER